MDLTRVVRGWVAAGRPDPVEEPIEELEEPEQEPKADVKRYCPWTPKWYGPSLLAGTFGLCDPEEPEWDPELEEWKKPAPDDDYWFRDGAQAYSFQRWRR